MPVISKAAIILAGVVGLQPAAGSGPVPATPAVTVRQILTTQALVGETVVVSGRCLDRNAPAVARGSRPMSGGVWQIEDNGVAAWVVGRMPEGCGAGAVTITARVAQDTLPKLGPPRTLRQYLVVR
jgi:hypothetical protein